MAKTAGSGDSRNKQEQAKAKATAKTRTGGGRKTKSIEERTNEVSTKRHSIKALFESQGFQQLGQIEYLFTKAMADQLGMNHGRFIDKLKNPVKFSVKDLYKFAYYTGIAPVAMLQQVSKEVERNRQVVAELKKIKPLPGKNKDGR